MKWSIISSTENGQPGGYSMSFMPETLVAERLEHMAYTYPTAVHKVETSDKVQISFPGMLFNASVSVDLDVDRDRKINLGGGDVYRFLDALMDAKRRTWEPDVGRNRTHNGEVHRCLGTRWAMVWLSQQEMLRLLAQCYMFELNGTEPRAASGAPLMSIKDIKAATARGPEWVAAALLDEEAGRRRKGALSVLRRAL